MLEAIGLALAGCVRRPVGVSSDLAAGRETLLRGVRAFSTQVGVPACEVLAGRDGIPLPECLLS
jgi:hypothetical protein